MSRYSRGQPYVTFSLLSTANANTSRATSCTRGAECYRLSVVIVCWVAEKAVRCEIVKKTGRSSRVASSVQSSDKEKSEAAKRPKV